MNDDENRPQFIQKFLFFFIESALKAIRFYQIINLWEISIFYKYLLQFHNKYKIQQTKMSRGYNNQYYQDYNGNYNGGFGQSYNQNQSGYNTRQSTRSEQKLIQDQNYSNEIFYGLLSTLESIVLYYQGATSQYGNKMFKNYDRVNYSSKNLQELKSQLQSQIFVFQASKKIFLEENRGVQWQLPKNFNQEQSIKFINDAMQIFQLNKDVQAFNLAKDVLSILDNRFNNLYSQNVNLKIDYTEAEKKKFKNDLVINGIRAGEEMDKRQTEVLKYENVSELSAVINTQNATFNQLTNTSNQIEEEISQPEWSFLVFSNEYQPNLKNLVGYNRNQFKNVSRYFEDENKLKNCITGRQLERNYTYIVPVVIKKSIIQIVGNPSELSNQ